METDEMRNEYYLTKKFFNILGIDYEDKEEKEYKAVTIKNEMDILVRFVFDKNGSFIYLG